MKISFCSTVDKTHREAVETLLFFNPQQHRARKGILRSLQRFGHPCIKEGVHGITFQVGEQETHVIFAYDQEDAGKHPLGVVIFLRCNKTDLSIVHLAVQPEYTTGGHYGDEGLTFQLVDEVRKVGRKVKGIERIVFFYHGEQGLPL